MIPNSLNVITRWCHCVLMSEDCSDDLFISVWKSVVDQCIHKLEPYDLSEAVQIKNLKHFQTKLHELQLSCSDNDSTIMIGMLYPTLDHYDAMAAAFVAMMHGNVDVSLMWGLLYLVIKVRFLRFLGHRYDVAGSVVHVIIVNASNGELHRAHHCKTSKPGTQDLDSARINTASAT